MLILSTRADKVFVEEPESTSRASYLLLKDYFTKQILDEWEKFRNAFFDKHEPLTCHYCSKTGLVREIQDPCNKEQLKTLATVDHIIPLSKGGKKYDESICVVACFPCNNRKKDKTKK